MYSWFRQHARLAQGLVAGIFTLIWLMLLQMHSVDVNHLDLLLQDTLIYHVPAQQTQTSHPVTIVDIDDASIQRVAQWPWPRYTLAQLIGTLQQSNPQAMVMDILFSEPDRTSLETIKSSYQREFGLDLSFSGVPEGMTDNDGYFAEVIRRSAPVIGSRLMMFDQSPAGHIRHTVTVTGDVGLLHLPMAQYDVTNIDRLDQVMSGTGFVNVEAENNGILRRVPLLINTPHGIVPGLALATLMEMHGIRQIAVSHSAFGPVVTAGRYHIPVDRDGSVWLRFSDHARRHPSIPAADVLSEENMPASNAVVMIGASSATLHDLVTSPQENGLPGTEIHAILLDNIVSGTALRHPEWLDNWLTGLSLLLLLGGALLMIFLPLTRAVVGVVLLTALPLALSLSLFWFRGIYLPVMAPLTGMLLLTILLEIIHHILLHLDAADWKRDVSNSQQFILQAMATVCETRDPETGGHVERTRHYVRVLANTLHCKGHPEAGSPSLGERLFQTAPLHDIGKVAIPDEVLMKPGRLTDEEFSIMKTHTNVGQKILDQAAKTLSKPGVFFQLATEIASSHHERWDGKGYPYGLAGKDIPFSARIMAIADVYDALVSARVYKPGMPHEKAMSIIVEGRGSQFDPDVVDAFIDVNGDFQAIAMEFKSDE